MVGRLSEVLVRLGLAMCRYGIVVTLMRRGLHVMVHLCRSLILVVLSGIGIVAIRVALVRWPLRMDLELVTILHIRWAARRHPLDLVFKPWQHFLEALNPEL